MLFHGNAQNEFCEKLGLTNGQFFAVFRYKNLWWEVNETIIGFGDLTNEQIDHIRQTLQPTEEFKGWNEHHFSEGYRQANTPMVIIANGNVMHRADIVKEHGR